MANSKKPPGGRPPVPILVGKDGHVPDLVPRVPLGRTPQDELDPVSLDELEEEGPPDLPVTPPDPPPPPVSRSSLLGRPVIIRRVSPRRPDPAMEDQNSRTFFSRGNPVPPAKDEPEEVLVPRKHIGGPLARFARWIPQRKRPKTSEAPLSDEQVNEGLDAQERRNRNRVWLGRGAGGLLILVLALGLWAIFAKSDNKPKAASETTQVATSQSTPPSAPTSNAPAQQASSPAAPAAPAAESAPPTPPPPTTPAAASSAPPVVATPSPQPPVPAPQPTAATPPPVEQASAPAPPPARAIPSLAEQAAPKPTPPPASTSVQKEEKATVSSAPAKEEPEPKPAKAEVKVATRKVAPVSASSILVATPLPMCEGWQIQCPEGKSGCMTRIQSAGHSEATARGACWRCTDPCQTALVLVDPTVTPSFPPSTNPEPLMAPPPPTPTIPCPEGKAACIARLTPLHGVATARGACWRCRY